MTSSDYLQHLLQVYQTSYDLTVPYSCGGVNYAAYGYFYAQQEKYILVREAQMWETKGFDHVFFLCVENTGQDILEEMDRVIRTVAEPELVRNKARFPVENHMYSDITYVIISEGNVKPQIVKQIKKFRFSRNYLFTIRGWCEGRVVVIDLAENSVYGNAKAKKLLPLYRELLSK